MKHLLILNGSPAGEKGNCAIWIKLLLAELQGKAKVEVIHLAKTDYNQRLQNKIAQASGYVFVTGTYWDSWGSPLQKFLEQWTELEGTKELVGKPAAVFVLMHSVGGKSILSRLQGVLNTMGLLIPPMSGMVYSLLGDLALKSTSTHEKDFWVREDIPLILQNLLSACDLPCNWQHWPVDKKDPSRKWLKLK